MSVGSQVQDPNPSTRRVRPGGRWEPAAEPDELPDWLAEPEDEPTPPAPIAPIALVQPERGRSGRLVPRAFQLEICRGREPIARRVFTELSVRIGRSPRCTLCLDDPTVSRMHAEIGRTVGGWVVRDLRSTNGVKVNGRLVSDWALNEGDELVLGDFTLRVAFDILPGLLPAAQTSSADEAPAAEVVSSAAARAPAPPEVEGVFGRTISLPPARADAPEVRERSVNQRAYLRCLEGAQRAGIRVCQLVLERDVYLLGGGEEADLRLSGTLVPRVAAVVVRGWGGWSLVQVASWPWVTRLNGHPVDDREWLEDGDELLLPGGLKLSFHLGLPR